MWGSLLPHATPHQTSEDSLRWEVLDPACRCLRPHENSESRLPRVFPVRQSFIQAAHLFQHLKAHGAAITLPLSCPNKMYLIRYKRQHDYVEKEPVSVATVAEGSVRAHTSSSTTGLTPQGEALPVPAVGSASASHPASLSITSSIPKRSPLSAVTVEKASWPEHSQYRRLSPSRETLRVL